MGLIFPRSDTLDFRLRRFVKDVVYIPATPTNLRPLQQQSGPGYAATNKGRIELSWGYLRDNRGRSHLTPSREVFPSQCVTGLTLAIIYCIQNFYLTCESMYWAHRVVKWENRAIKCDTKRNEKSRFFHILKSFWNTFCTGWEALKESIQLHLSIEPGTFQIFMGCYNAELYYLERLRWKINHLLINDCAGSLESIGLYTVS
jgi:hypothetical protein